MLIKLLCFINLIILSTLFNSLNSQNKQIAKVKPKKKEDDIFDHIDNFLNFDIGKEAEDFISKFKIQKYSNII